MMELILEAIYHCTIPINEHKLKENNKYNEYKQLLWNTNTKVYYCNVSTIIL